MATQSAERPAACVFFGSSEAQLVYLTYASKRHSILVY